MGKRSGAVGGARPGGGGPAPRSRLASGRGRGSRLLPPGAPPASRPLPSPSARGPSRGERLRGPGLADRRDPALVPSSTSADGGALWPGPGARGAARLGQAPAPHPGRPRHLGPLLRGERADTPAGGGAYWTLSSLTGGGLAAGGHRVPAWGERGVRGGGRGGTTEKTSPPFPAAPLARAVRPQGGHPCGPSAPSRSWTRPSPAGLPVDTGVQSRSTRSNPPTASYPEALAASRCSCPELRTHQFVPYEPLHNNNTHY